MFYTAYSSRREYHSNSGQAEYIEKTVRFLPDGNMELVDGKVRDRQAEIDSYKESCIVSNLIKRFENGDSLALSRGAQGAFIDITSFPKNAHEALKLNRSVETLYDSLGDDIKAKYTDLSSFCEAFSSQDKFNDFMKFSGDIIKQRKAKLKANSPKVKEGEANA